MHCWATCTWAENTQQKSTSNPRCNQQHTSSGNLCLLLDGEGQSEEIFIHAQACVGMLMCPFKENKITQHPPKKIKPKQKPTNPQTSKKPQTTEKQRKSTIKHTHTHKTSKPARNKNQFILLPRITKAKPWMCRALRTFSAWDTFSCDWIILKSQDPFHGFCVTRLFSFTYFCSCYRLQMSDMSPLLTTSIMEITLQAWNIRLALTNIAFFSLLNASERMGNDGKLIYAAH